MHVSKLQFLKKCGRKGYLSSKPLSSLDNVDEKFLETY
jgi:hypothetical protein